MLTGQGYRWREVVQPARLLLAMNDDAEGYLGERLVKGAMNMKAVGGVYDDNTCRHWAS